MTAHWIAEDSLERVLAVLACRRLRGSHTFDVLAGALEDIHASYGIANKVCKTDSGSNFVKAFSMFGPVDEVDSDDDMGSDTNDDDGIIYQEKSAELDANDYAEYHLPHRHRRACHTTTAVPATPPSLCLPHQHRCANVLMKSLKGYQQMSGHVSGTGVVSKHCLKN